MNKAEKKALIQSLIKGGDPRSYNQISADLELEIWAIKHKGHIWVQNKIANRNSK
jgi:hypothetical protein